MSISEDTIKQSVWSLFYGALKHESTGIVDRHVPVRAYTEWILSAMPDIGSDDFTTERFPIIIVESPKIKREQMFNTNTVAIRRFREDITVIDNSMANLDKMSDRTEKVIRANLTSFKSNGLYNVTINEPTIDHPILKKIKLHANLYSIVGEVGNVT